MKDNKSVTLKCFCLVLLLLLPFCVTAQTEGVGSQWLKGVEDFGRLDVHQQLRLDSLRFQPDLMQPSLVEMKNPTVQTFTQLDKQGMSGFNLWRGASLDFYGATSQMPGLMNTEVGSMALQQQVGRWHFAVSGNVNKYWMPWQRSLATQFGFGGTIGYDLSETVTLHAFGYYYANKMMVGPAMSPYVNTTTYGGYADIRISKNFGTNVGVRRYLNPMSGRWETAPVVSPYIKFNNGAKFELPLGDLLKEIIWGNQNHPLQFRPHPMSHPPVKR